MMNKSTKQDRNAKIIILVVTLALTILFATLAGVSGTSGGSYGGSNNTNSKNVSGALTVGTTTNVRLSGTTYVYYRFSPTTSGTYVFTSSSTSNFDTYAELYDSSWNPITYNDDGGSGYNFLISYYLYSGRTYYLGVRMHSSSASGTVSLTVTR